MVEKILEDTVIIIPSRRETVATLETLCKGIDHPIVLLADPFVFYRHYDYYKWKRPDVIVYRGKSGLAPQIAECYRVAAQMGYKYWFRLDDDLPSEYFVTEDGYCGLIPAMVEARECARQLGTSLVGFVNSGRRDWLGYPGEYKRSYALITGNSQLCIASGNPEQFLDESIPRYEDVYRSLSHRKLDGAVGRVQFIGVEKRVAMRDTSMPFKGISEEAIEIILRDFPTMIRYLGPKSGDGGRQTWPKFSYLRGGYFS